jgi:hypothetical protein
MKNKNDEQMPDFTLKHENSNEKEKSKKSSNLMNSYEEVDEGV